MNQWSQGAFYYYCFKTQIFTIKLSSNHLLKVNQIKQLHVGTILSFYYFGKTVHLRFCSSNTKLYLNKFDAKAQRGIFLGYSERSKAYRVYNSETLCVEESMHVKFDDKEPGNETPEQDESFADI